MDLRVEKLLILAAKQACEAAYITKAENIFYLSGFTSGQDASLFISPEKQYLLTDGRYVEQAQQECPDWDIVEVNSLAAIDKLPSLGIKYKRIAFEAHNISYSHYLALEAALPNRWQTTEKLTESLRLIKSAEELDLLRKSAAISDQVFTDIAASLAPGTREDDLAEQIRVLLKKYGCTGEAFATIVLTGVNASRPHGQPGSTPFSEGDMVTMDYGGIYHHYVADMTRTVAIGKADRKLADYYAVVLEAQMKGLDTIKAGVPVATIDNTVRGVLSKYNLEAFFAHSTGHGIGLEIHEDPKLSKNVEGILQSGMVVTIEPGIYIPGWGGIRIEDSVIVTDNGHERITRSDKHLLIFE